MAASNADLYRSPERLSLFYALCLLLPGIVIGWNTVGTRFPKRSVQVLDVTMLLLLILSLLSCGGVSNDGTTATGREATGHLSDHCDGYLFGNGC